ncbi:MAG: RecX family transcriptional regulator [Novosphingobium sp.]
MQDEIGHNPGRPPGGQSGRQRKARPLDGAGLAELALAYVARFATSEAKLAAYLARKLRERGWIGEGEDFPDVQALARRYAELGYVDDEAYAQARSSGLLRRGYGPRRVAQALYAAGIGERHREAASPSDEGARRAALVMARKRRFGPFGGERPEPARRERQIAAMIRAGHRLDNAREIVDAASIEAAEEWAGWPCE